MSCFIREHSYQHENYSVVADTPTTTAACSVREVNVLSSPQRSQGELCTVNAFSLEILKKYI